MHRAMALHVRAHDISMLRTWFLCVPAISIVLFVILWVCLQARVHVPDDRFTWLCNVYKPKSQVPAFLDICDIAGLVK
jgi:hypothetical protein